MQNPSSMETQPNAQPPRAHEPQASIPAPTHDNLQAMRPVSTTRNREVVNDFYQPRRVRYENQKRKRVRRGGELGNWIWVILAVGLLSFTLVATIGLILVLRTNDNGAVAAQVADNGEPPIEPTSIFFNNPSTSGTPGSGGEDTVVRGAMENSLVIEPWNGTERFTVLLMGMDRRPDENISGCTRTDTMLIVSIDPLTKQIGILSLPRDLYIEIPNYGLSRINTACRLGDLNEPGSGPRLAMQTVQYNFGIRIHDYIMVDFQTFISFIDRIGGVDIDVPRDISDPTYPSMNYGYDPFFIGQGPNHLDGPTALKYARSRHDSDDTDRAKRQQQVLFAAWDKVLSLNMLDNLAVQALPLWNDFSEGIETGLSFDQFIQLALYGKDIPRENIHTGVVNWGYAEGYRTPGGAQVLIPNRYLVGQLMIEVFGETYNQ